MKENNYKGKRKKKPSSYKRRIWANKIHVCWKEPVSDSVKRADEKKAPCKRKLLALCGVR